MGVRVYEKDGYGTHHNAAGWQLGPEGDLAVVDAEGSVLAVYAPGGWVKVRYYTKPAPEEEEANRKRARSWF